MLVFLVSLVSGSEEDGHIPTFWLLLYYWDAGGARANLFNIAWHLSGLCVCLRASVPLFSTDSCCHICVSGQVCPDAHACFFCLLRIGRQVHLRSWPQTLHACVLTNNVIAKDKDVYTQTDNMYTKYTYADNMYVHVHIYIWYAEAEMYDTEMYDTPKFIHNHHAWFGIVVFF